jgi:ankyrin repeat protein
MSHLNKVNIHIKDKNGYTPLHSAAESGNARIIMALLQYPGIQTSIFTVPLSYSLLHKMFKIQQRIPLFTAFAAGLHLHLL